MTDSKPVKETCIQNACFFLPFFERGEWRCSRGKSPWQTIKKMEATPENVEALASYTGDCISQCAKTMEALQRIHDDWDITVKKDGIWMETETMIYEDILPKLEEAGISENDYELFSEYTRKWGMI